MEALIDLFLQEKEISKLVEELEIRTRPSTYRRAIGGAKPIFFKALQQSVIKPILIVSPNLLQAQRTYEDL